MPGLPCLLPLPLSSSPERSAIAERCPEGGRVTVKDFTHGAEHALLCPSYLSIESDFSHACRTESSLCTIRVALG